MVQRTDDQALQNRNPIRVTERAQDQFGALTDLRSAPRQGRSFSKSGGEQL